MAAISHQNSGTFRVDDTVPLGALKLLCLTHNHTHQETRPSSTVKYTSALFRYTTDTDDPEPCLSTLRYTTDTDDPEPCLSTLIYISQRQ